MIEVKGKYADTKIFNDFVDETSMSQVYSLLNHIAFAGSTVRFMPDIHAGAGCVIGTTTTIPLTNRKIIPNITGVDIGCGMICLPLKFKNIDFDSLENHVRSFVPLGFSIHKNMPPNFSNRIEFPYPEYKNELKEVVKRTGQNIDYVLNSIGTLGGGNHFIEVDKDDDGNLYLIIHTGSRNFGLKVALYHQAIAEEYLKSKRSDAKHEAMMNVAPKEREAMLKKFTPLSKVPKGMEYLEGKEADNYLHDMKIAQEYAEINRKCILKTIVTLFGIRDVSDAYESVHNYIDLKKGIIRKGAISALKGEKVIIPLSMGDGVILGTGKGNEDWNYSAPHGAGRKLSRSKAKATLDLEEFKDKMKGIYTTCISKDTLDESPMAYKDADETIKYIEDTVENTKRLLPVYVIKG